jgi:serine/threonine protein kinase
MGNSHSANDGEKLGSYVVEKILGKGSFAEVKLGRHVKTGEREIKFLKLLCHPHISMLYEVIETDRHVVLIMEHASGGELLNYIRRSELHRLKEKEARRIFRQIVSAVDYCHQNSLIHRDIKPENILLDKNMDVKMIDFGFSNTFQEGVLLDSFIGSPHYAAPELLQGIKYSGPEVDMWSLGVLLYVMICGRLPFKDKDMKVLYEKIKKGEVVFPEFVSDNAKNLIQRLLVIDPKKRATMREVYDHIWIKEGYSADLSNYLHVRPGIVHVDSRLFHQLLKYGYEKEEALRALQSEEKSPTKNIYYLLWEKNLRETAMEAAKTVEHPPVFPTSKFKRLSSFFQSFSSSARRKEKTSFSRFAKSPPIHNKQEPRKSPEPSIHLSKDISESPVQMEQNPPSASMPVIDTSVHPEDEAFEVPGKISHAPSDLLATEETSRMFVKDLDTGEICALSRVEESVRRQIQHRDHVQYRRKYFKRHFDEHQISPILEAETIPEGTTS